MAVIRVEPPRIFASSYIRNPSLDLICSFPGRYIFRNLCAASSSSLTDLPICYSARSTAQGKDPVPPPHWSPATAHVLCLTFFVKIWVCRDLGDLNPRRPLPLYRFIPLIYSVCKLLTLQYTFKICYYILLSVKKNLLCFKDFVLYSFNMCFKWRRICCVTQWSKMSG